LPGNGGEVGCANVKMRPSMYGSLGRMAGPIKQDRHYCYLYYLSIKKAIQHYMLTSICSLKQFLLYLIALCGWQASESALSLSYKESSMSHIQQSCSMSALLLVLIIISVLAPGAARAYDGSTKIPENAHAKSYGGGWECNYGYKEENNTCRPIKIPDHAYLNSYGSRWECNRGYRSSGRACVAIKVPANGYLDDASYGPGWRCERGFRQTTDACEAVKVPENGHISSSGNDWECNKPYHRDTNKCALE
jgi:hypothetical protein